ncbi:MULTISPECIES: hypothetical protein [Bacillus]|uniref:hypothetical protein n=1 Tax=Bacillus TaxID=1386 RepID=UPI001BFFECAC|nr:MULTISPECIES: hypothetical protein [Bacillus]MBT9285837.1 hypothetical protein [Bacillus velezensis]MCX2820188.1 hypothetical protein [Bacillus sp. H1F1]
MKFFEARNPYSALIKANTKEKAMKLYVEEVANDDGHLSEDIKEVGKVYATIMHDRTLTVNHELRPMSDIFDEIESNEEMVLYKDRRLF